MASDPSTTTCDLILRGGTIIDGTGAPSFVGDVAVANGQIVEVAAAADGGCNATAVREIDADGQLITPGFVDIHTHYDGQVCWDKQVTPSSWHGVTTIVMGNCGVGFAPVRPGSETALVELMESVEDIPGTALHEGIPWGWESFDQYLDAIDTPYTIDIGAQVPHVAVRHYVMGDRCYDDATVDDIAAMASITRGGMAAGALGFSTSRFYGHLDKAGNHVPGTNATSDEIMAIGEAFAELDHGTMEIISDHLDRVGRAVLDRAHRSQDRPSGYCARGFEREREGLGPGRPAQRSRCRVPAPGGGTTSLGADDAGGNRQSNAPVPLVRRDQGAVVR